MIEHVEEAGVHSGDATLVTPLFSLGESIIEKVRKCALEICRALEARGLVNMQFVVKGNDVYMVEFNLRASKSMPFVSKVKGVNMMEYAADVLWARS